MLRTIKYSIGDRVRTRIHYKNDSRSEVEAEIKNIVFGSNKDDIRYEIAFEGENSRKKYGCTGCSGYVFQDDVIEVL